jgi:hypothetical protein
MIDSRSNGFFARQSVESPDANRDRRATHRLDTSGADGGRVVRTHGSAPRGSPDSKRNGCYDRGTEL